MRQLCFAGSRAYGANDLSGQQMAAAAASLVGEAQFLDVIAYLHTLAPVR